MIVTGLEEQGVLIEQGVAPTGGVEARGEFLAAEHQYQGL